MAIVKMSKLRLLGLKKQQNKILAALQQTKSIELKKTEDFDFLASGTDIHNDEDLNEKLSRLTSAIHILEEAEKQSALQKTEGEKPQKVKKPLFSVRSSISFNQFKMITENEYEIFSAVSELESCSEKLLLFKNEISKHESIIEQIKNFSEIDVPLNMFKDTANTKIMLCTLPAEFEKPLTEFFEKQQRVIIQKYKGIGQVVFVLICTKEDYTAFSEKLTQLSFSRIFFDYDKTPSELINTHKQQIEYIKEQRAALLGKIMRHKPMLSDIKLLYDYYNIAVYTKEQKKNFKSSASTFILEAFVPEESIEAVQQTLKKETPNILIEFSEINEQDNPPTYVRNNALVKPFEAVTDMYSPPSHNDRDPNLYAGIFFFIFFGIMLSDAGYGLVLAIVCFFLLKKFSMEDATRKVITVIALGGISTLLWGTVFGGWFGIDLAVAADNGSALAAFLNSLKWFNPLEEPLLMMALCLGLGVFQILFGLGLKGADLIKKGKTLDALMDVGSWYLLFIGIGLMALGSFSKSLPEIGKYVAISGLVLLVLTQGREKKGIFAKIGKGFTSLYGIVGYIGDIISYSRLFGLGLASGVVGLIMNTLANLMLGTWYLALFGVIVLIVGHGFNIGINVLGAYVHNSRLQYVEFFSRFYTGGGRTFVPYGSKLKYHIVK
ncbi:MAG: V-type ATP synthase subunit I [Clostridia bacterium]|nr:V-type ATP synthase subunit I [Clostridia bacterium]